MMNVPIISPWLIYLIGVVDGVREMFVVPGVVAITAIIISIFAIMIITSMLDDADGPEELAKYKRNRKVTAKALLISIIITFICAFLGRVLPNSTTITQMIVAQNLTPANINKGVKIGKGIKDEIKKDVLDIIMSINKIDKNTEVK